MKVEIKDWYDIWDKDYTLELKPGLTVLIGPNGAGKTTVINELKGYCKEQNIKYIDYNNFVDGGKNSIDVASFRGDTNLMATLMTASEGQQIYINIGQKAKLIGKFVKENKKEKSLFIFFDAIDSGLSIDNIREVKNFFKLVLNNSPNNLYIVCAANMFELIKNETCMDVRYGKALSFSDYDSFADFICKK